jgi:ATP-dependent Lon protease
LESRPSGGDGNFHSDLNEEDLLDVPEEAKQKLKFVPGENVDEVLAAALEKDGAQSTSESKLA